MAAFSHMPKVILGMILQLSTFTATERKNGWL